MTDQNYPLIRHYEREFTSIADTDEFIAAIDWIKDRIMAVNMRYQLFVSEQNPLKIYEIWSYPDEMTMQWVQQAMEGATAIPKKFSVTTRADTLHLKAGFEVEEG